MNADQAIRNYRCFLDASWPFVNMLNKEAPGREALWDDWAQANWEFLVESRVCMEANQFLEVYGDGADSYGSSSRIWKPEAIPTHRITCVTLSGKPITDVLSGEEIRVDELTFGYFVSWDGKQYEACPSFDHVLLENDSNIFVVEIGDIHFGIEEL